MKRIPHAIAVAAVLIVSTALTACGGESHDELLASAKQYLSQQDRTAAIVQLKAALQQQPDSGEARFLLGDALLKGGDLTAAVVELEKASDLKYDDNAVVPALARALLGTGQAKKVTDLYSRMNLNDPNAASDLKATVSTAFAAQGLLERSKAAMQSALQLNPKNGVARLIEARFRAADGEIDEALRLVDQVLVDEPTRLEASQFKGELLVTGKGDLERGAQAFRDALRVDPRFLPAHAALISMMLRKRDVPGFKAQVAELEKVLPNHPETRYQKVQLAFVDGDNDRAREGMQQLLRNAPDYPKFLQLAGAIELRARSLLQAEKHLVKALKVAPSLVPARRLLAETYLQAGEADRALVLLKPLLERDRVSADTLALVAEAHLQAGDLPNAETYFTRAAKVNPSDLKVRTALAMLMVRSGSADAGLSQLDSIAAADPSTYADLALISSRLRRGELDSALKAIDRLQTKVPDRALPHHLRSGVLISKRDPAGARASLEKAIALEPSYFPSIARLSELDLADKKPDEARRRFETLLAADPRNYRAMLAVVDIRKRTGASPAEVTTQLTEVVQGSPSEPRPRLLLINHLLASREANAARVAAQEAVAALPDEMSLVDALGRAQLATGEVQQAIGSFGKVAAAQPDTVQPQLNLADAHMAAKQYDEAERNLRRALEISPKLVSAQRGLVLVAMASKRPDLAAQIAREVQQQRPDESVGYLLEGEVEASRHRWDRAVAAYRLALDRVPATQTAVALHSLYRISGRHADADKLAADWQAKHPRDAQFVAHLGTLAMNRKEYAAAEAHFRRSLKIQPNDATALNNVAWLMLQQGKKGALAPAEQAQQLLPADASVMDTLAAALASEAKLDQAIEWQRKAVAAAPKNPAYQLNLAKLLLSAGDRNAARTELTQLEKLGSGFAAQAEVTALLAGLR